MTLFPISYNYILRIRTYYNMALDKSDLWSEPPNIDFHTMIPDRGELTFA